MAKSRAKMANMATKMASQNQQNSKEIAQGGQHGHGAYPPKNDPPMWFGGRTDGGQTRTKPSALGLGLVAALLRRGDLDAADA